MGELKMPTSEDDGEGITGELLFFNIHIYTCMCVYIYTHIYMYVYVYTYLCIYMMGELKC